MANKAFTLIELLVLVAFIGIIASVGKERPALVVKLLDTKDLKHQGFTFLIVSHSLKTLIVFTF